MTIDINCDLGEITGPGMEGVDEAIMPFITSANIACGLHAGDPLTMERTVMLAKRYGVAIGAHPGYADREGFGRNPMNLTEDEIRAIILFQVRAMKTISEALGEKLNHVKCHGALYNKAATDRELSVVIARAVKEVDSSLIFVGLSGSEMIKAAEETGLQAASEVFADRTYNDDGTLVSRQQHGAVLDDPDIIIERAVRMVIEKNVKSITGKIIPLKADTICIHGDNPAAPRFAEKLLKAFTDAGIEVKPIQKRSGNV